MARRARTLTAMAAALATGAAIAVQAPVSAAAVEPRGTAIAANDYCRGQCDDILPPGENGNATLADILANRTLGTRPPHTDDQLAEYGSLVNGYTGLTNDKLGSFFNDSSFGVSADQIESTTKPRGDVTIVRDKKAGVPHITGTTRSGTEFGAGYAAANDRLWLMDLFRHIGRGQLTPFAGGAPANRALEQSLWKQAPYTEQDLQAQIDRAAASGPRGVQALRDVADYLDGINTYIDKSYNARNFPGEYVLTGQVDAVTNAGSIDHFTPTDLIAIGAVIGGLFGTGGGGEVQSALVKLAAEQRYDVGEGDKVWQSFREQNDPEAATTLHDGQQFPYSGAPANPTGVAMPDAGSVTDQQQIFDPTGSATNPAPTKDTVPAVPTPKGGAPDLNAAKGIFDNGVLPANILSRKHGMSNALLVSGKSTDSGHPVAVFGPQTGYFAPQLLMLQEIQGPGISARGASFAGLSMYVELGRGQDYSWSATSAGQDVTDTFAVELCDPKRPVTKDSNFYRFHGQCLPMEQLEKDNAWSPTVADSTPAGSYKMIAFRTKYGIVQQRGTVAGKPVAFASLRSSYQHEAESLLGFQEFNDPDFVKSANDFQRAAHDVNFTFNWFYADSKDIAYYDSGDNPVRAAGTDPNLPIAATPANEWQRWDPATNTAAYTPPSAHPNAVDQDYFVSWNNKPAQQYSSADFGNGSVHRGNLLDDRVKKMVHSGQKVTRAALTQAMSDAAAADLRGENVLPQLLRMINSQPVADPALAAVVTDLQSWQQNGALRKETTAGSHTYTDARTIQTMDAWWPLLVQAEFQPGLGDALFNAMVGKLQINESPSGGQTGPNAGPADANEAQPHKGSAFQFGWWSYVDKDIRSILGDRVAGPLAKPYCGGGNQAQCRQVLLNSLKQAAALTAGQVYPGDADCKAGDQWCADSIIQRPLGGVTDDKISWQNRPTFQQVVQYPTHR